MKKILFCTVNFHQIINGPTKFIRWVFEEFSKNQYNVDFRVLTTDIVDESFDGNPRIYNAEVKTSFYNKPVAKLVYSKRITDEAERIYKTFPYDIIVFNNCILSYHYKTKNRIVKIGFINDLNNLDYYQVTPYSKLKLLISRAVLRYIERTVSKSKLNKIVVNSEYLKGRVIDEYKLREDKVVKLYKAVDTTNFEPVIKKKINKGTVKVLFVKSDYIRGGLFVLIEALTLLECFVELIVISKDKQILEDRFQNYKSSNLSFSFLGKQTQDKVFKYMRNSDIFCVPATNEALGVANMEALINALPVVSTKVGGIPEVLDYGEGGWLVEPNNVNQLKDALTECIQNDELRYNRTKKGQSHIRSVFSKQNTLDTLLEIFEQCEL